MWQKLKEQYYSVWNELSEGNKSKGSQKRWGDSSNDLSVKASKHDKDFIGWRTWFKSSVFIK
jgi:hypothetical protein